MAPKKSWRGLVVEGLVIVASILLALTADAWWEGIQDRADERASLQLVARDIAETVEQLAAMESALHRDLVALDSVYEALSGEVALEDRPTMSRNLIRAILRRSSTLPSAAYTDLVSTGSLRLVDSRPLRDELVGFYQLVARRESVMEKNSALFVDQLAYPILYGGGLLQSTGVGTAAFEYRGDRLWSLPPASPEWDQVRSALQALAGGKRQQIGYAEELRAAAAGLLERIEARLGHRAGEPF